VAILIDGSYEDDGAGNMEYVPRTTQELDGYRKIVENIVGLDMERGDRVEVLNVQFSEPHLPEPGGFLSGPLMDKLPGIINKVLFLVGLGLIFMLFRNMGAKLVQNVAIEVGSIESTGGGSSGGRINPKYGAVDDQELEALDPNDINSAAKRKIKMEEQAQSLALEKPEEVARLIKTWMTTRI
jgi:flagellar M-ring protein FliF